MRWITIGPADQPDTSVVLYPPLATPGITDDERRTIVEMMAKGSYASIVLATADLDGAFERLAASGAEVVQEPADQPYGVRDCAFRDPAGNMVRIQELRRPPPDPVRANPRTWLRSPVGSPHGVLARRAAAPTAGSCAPTTAVTPAARAR